MKKINFPGELALAIVLVINSLAVCLMAKSGFGISTISSVPYVFSAAFPIFTFGTWNYIFQTALVLVLMILRRAFCPGYLFSFVIGIIFGKMIDVHDAWLTVLPDGMAFRILYFVIAFIIVAFGICLANNCMLPIIPTDVFPRDLSEITGLSYKRVKTTFDLSCLTTTIVLSLFILHHLYGVGVGTVICAFLTGKSVSICQTILDRRFHFYLLSQNLVHRAKSPAHGH